MRLRWRHIPLYVFGVLCWAWAIGCAGYLVIAGLHVWLTRDMRIAWVPMAAAAPAVVLGCLIGRHFLNRVDPPTRTPLPPGFEVMPPR